MRSSTTLSVLALAVAATLARPAAASDAMGLFKQGRALVEAGKWAEACPLFDEAHRIEKQALGIALNLADCHKHVGKLASAWSTYQEAEFIAKKIHDTEREHYAHDEAAAIEPRLSHLRINAASVPGLVVRRDDEDVGKGMLGVSLPIDPGNHKIEASAPGFAVWTTSIIIGAERDSQTIDIPVLQKSAPGETGGARPSGGWGPQRIAGLGVGLGGVVGLAVGAIFGVQAIGKKNDSNANGHCDAADLCDPIGKGLRADSIRAGNISTGLFIGGGVLAAGGVVLMLTAPSGGGKAPEGTRPSAGLAVGPGSIVFKGRW